METTKRPDDGSVIKILTILFFLTFLAVQGVAAASVRIESDQSAKYLTFVPDKEESVAAYTIQLNFSQSTEISLLKALPPYAGAVNIRNDLGYAKIAAFSIDTPGSHRLAELAYSGDGSIDVLVLELYDAKGATMPVTNAVTVGPAQTITTQPLPAYDVRPSPRSPISSDTNPSPVSGGVIPAASQNPNPEMTGNAGGIATPGQGQGAQPVPQQSRTTTTQPVSGQSGVVPTAPSETRTNQAASSALPTTQRSAEPLLLTLGLTGIAFLILRKRAGK